MNHNEDGVGSLHIHNNNVSPGDRVILLPFMIAHLEMATGLIEEVYIESVDDARRF